MSLIVVEPTVITPAMLVASTLAEHLPAWDGITVWADKARVVSPDGLSVYESVQAANAGHNPLEDVQAEWWARVGASNRWALFDREINLATQATGSFSVTLRPGPVGGMGLHGMADMSSVRMQLVNLDNGTIVRDTTHDLLADGIDTPREFFYTWPRPSAAQKVFTGLPPLGNAQMTLTFTGGSSMRIGEIILGPAFELGGSLRGLTFSLADYSTRDRDRWGRLRLEPGDFSRAPSVPFIFPTERLAKVLSLLSRFRGKPCLYIPSEVPGYAPLAVLGTYTRMRVDARTTRAWWGSLDLEGLSETLA